MRLRTAKIVGRNARELACDAAIAFGGSVHFNVYGNCLEFDLDDASALEKAVASNQERFSGIRAPERARRIAVAKVNAAEIVRRKIGEAMILAKFSS